MKQKISIRILSFLLALTMLIQMLPVQGIAATAESTSGMISDEQPEVSVLGEVESLREEDTKHFRLSDGSFVAVSYGMPVHYQNENGEWQDIDNTLVSDPKSNTYQTRNADTAVAFASSLESGRLFVTAKENTAVSMSLLDTAQALQMTAVEPELEAAALPPAEGNVYSRNAVAQIIAETPLVLSSEENRRGWDIEDVMPENLQSSLLYEEVFPGVDLLYTSSGYNIKEQIIVKEAQISYRYDFLLELSGLTANRNEDGSVSLLDAEENEIYVIPAPYMVDGAGAISYNVHYSIANTAQGTVFTVTADSTWLNAEDRAFPVMIDPSVIVGTSSGDFCATFIHENAPNQSTSNSNLVYIGAEPFSTSNLGRSRTFLHFSNLPSIPSGSAVVAADLEMKMASFAHRTIAQFAIGAYELTSDKPSAYSSYQSWLAAMTWNQNKPSYNTANVIDYAFVSAANQKADWDLTELVKKWYAEDTANTTIALAMINDTAVSPSSYAYAAFYAHNATNPPVLTVTYRNDVGIEPYYTYATLGGGSAGTAYISDTKGQLKIAKQLAGYASTVNPVSVNLIYNSDYYSLNAATDYQPTKQIGLSMTVGQGWTVDCIQKLVAETINGVSYLKYYDGDGTIHYFSEDGDSNIYRDEDGLGLKIQATATNVYTMTDNNGNSWEFTSKYLTAMQDSTGNRIRIYYSNYKLSKIVQMNAGQSEIIAATFTYNGEYLDTVKDYGNNTYKLNYTNGKLTSIQKNGTTIAQYTYTNNRITKMTDSESGYALAFSYTHGKVSQYKEMGGTTTGAIVDISYPNHSQITYQDYGGDRTKGTADDIYSHYLHDYKGRTVNAYTRNHEGFIIGASNSAYFTYDPSKTDAQIAIDKRNNRTLRTATIRATKRNLSYNVGFENSATYNTSGLNIVTTKARTGTKSLSGSIGVASLQYAWRPTESILKDRTFTFSAYVNTESVNNFAGKGIYLKVVDPSGNTWVGEPLEYKTPNGLDGGWARISVTFTSKVTGVHNLYVCSEGSASATGNFYVDDLQFELGDAPSTSNLLENGGFQMGTGSWVFGDSSIALSTEQKLSPSTHSLKIVGNPANANAYAYQDIPINLKGTQTYVLAGWVKANAVPDNMYSNEDSAQDTVKQCGLRAILYYSDGTTEYHYAPFDTDLSEWQFVSTGIVPKQPTKTVTKIRVVCAYERNANIAYFDDIALLRESVQAMTYDEQGRQIKSTDPEANDQDFTYHDSTDLIESFNGGYGTFEYDYDSYNRPITASNAYLTQSTTYDGVGNVTSTTLTSDTDPNAKKVQTTTEFTGGSKNRPTAATDATGARVTYNYDNAKAQMMSLPTRVTDANNTVVNTVYDDFYRPTQVSIENTATLDYTYSSGNLSTVKRTDNSSKSQTYSFTYDSFGNMLTLKVGTKTLATYTYGTGNGLLATQKYGNGATISFDYNDQNQVEKTTYPDGRTMTYTYTPDGQVYRATETGTGRTVDYVYGFDDRDRLISSEKKVNGTTVLRTRQLFNDNDQLTHENWKMGTKTYYRVLTYNTSTDYSLATVSMPTEETLTMTYDDLRRLDEVSGGLYTVGYTYRDRDATYTTTQVSRLSYSRTGATTLNFDYTYDILGNIATYKAPNKTAITYTYDNQGQLTKAEGAKTYSYTYDSVGNILTAFDGTDEHTYTYGDSNWHDKLMKFDGQSITYDDSGNPTSYYNGTRWTFGWSNGRNLTSASGGGKTLSFTYDLQDGTRATKTVGTEVHNYIYAGGKLLRETYGNTTLDFIYDVNGRPYAMIVNESTTYYYITNLQGDVINVVNSSGTIVASYEYDPYGNPVVQNETALGFTNPLRYRGYYWDSETQLYLCHSRYYDPATCRFINSDSYASTGQGIIGYNMFAYCANNPVKYIDLDGRECKRSLWSTTFNTIEDIFGEEKKTDDLTVAITYGNYISFTLGAFNVTFSNETAIDFKGNIQRNFTASFDATTAGTLSASVGNSGSVFFVPDTSYLNGDTYYTGGSISAPIPYTPLSFTGSTNVGQTSDGYWGLIFSGGVAPPSSKRGGEVHAGYSYTAQVTPRINIFTVLDKFIEYIE